MVIEKYIKCARCGKLVDAYIRFSAIARNAEEGIGLTTDVAAFNLAQSHRAAYGQEQVYCIECGTDISKELIGVKQEENNV